MIQKAFMWVSAVVLLLATVAFILFIFPLTDRGSMQAIDTLGQPSEQWTQYSSGWENDSFFFPRGTAYAMKQYSSETALETKNDFNEEIARISHTPIEEIRSQDSEIKTQCKLHKDSYRCSATFRIEGSPLFHSQKVEVLQYEDQDLYHILSITMTPD